ncbi:MAG: hypothetical protein AB1765_11445 [Candidatus Hydrogenedentota bacterium]
MLQSVRLSAPELSDITYVSEILSRGSFDDWKLLYQAVVSDPDGKVAQAIKINIKNQYLYGTNILWDGILKKITRERK